MGASRIVGIDLGTTNTLIAAWDGPSHQARVLEDRQGRALLPSAVRFPGDGGAPIVGHEALDPGAGGVLIRSFKRFMGRSVGDVEHQRALLGHDIEPGPRGTIRVRVGDRLVSPEELSAMVLRAIKEQGERSLGEPITRAVVTVPAYFDDAQRQATRHAARLAGLEAVRVLNEPTAAALAYGLGATASAARTVLVYDLGGGTFDASVLRLSPPEEAGGVTAFQVLATKGDTSLGGVDVDRALARLVADRAGLSPACEEVLRESERVKIALSEADAAEARVDGRTVRVSRAEVEELARPLVERTIECCRRALEDARLLTADGRVKESGLDAVVLVGGATRAPDVRRRVAEYFGMDPYVAVDPDRAIALGAAVQGALLSGEARDAMLLDVIPLSLGIQTVGGAVAKLIVRNSMVPTRAVETFSTSVDNQTTIDLNVYQGEREMAEDCRLLGNFKLRSLPPMPAGVPQVEVRFSVDAGGVLNVSAVERRSGVRASLQVVPSHGLSAEEVDRMEAESIAHAREDMARHRVVDLCVHARLDLRWITERLTAWRSRLDTAYVGELDELARALTSLVGQAEADWRSVDAAELAKAKDALDRASVRLHEVAISESLKGGTID